MSTHRWTPGPWTVEGFRCVEDDKGFFNISAEHEGEKILIAYTFHEPAFEECSGLSAKADAELVALAPEMAEAILALAEPQTRVVDESWVVHIEQPDAILELAEKLRKIGAAQ